MTKFDLWELANHLRLDLCRELDIAIAVANGDQQPPDDWKPELDRRAADFGASEMTRRLAEFDANDRVIAWHYGLAERTEQAFDRWKSDTPNWKRIIAQKRAKGRPEYEIQQRIGVTKHAIDVAVSKLADDRKQAARAALGDALCSAMLADGTVVTGSRDGLARRNLEAVELQTADFDFCNNTLTVDNITWKLVQIEKADGGQPPAREGISDKRAKMKDWFDRLAADVVVTENMAKEQFSDLTVRALRALFKEVIPADRRAVRGTAPSRRRS